MCVSSCMYVCVFNVCECICVYLCESGLYMCVYVSVSVRHKYRILFENKRASWRGMETREGNSKVR